MCNFTPVRNWVIAVGVLLGLAVSSAVFGFVMSQGKLPWTQIISTISYWAAVTWCTAGGITCFGLNSAVDTYCTCAKDRGTCTKACRDFQLAFWGIASAFLALWVVSMALATGVSDPGSLLVFWGVIIGASLAGIGLVIASISLGSCQTQG